MLLSLTICLTLQSHAEAAFDGAIEKSRDLDGRLTALIRRAVSQSDAAAHAALAFIDADLKRETIQRELFLGTGRTCRFVVDEVHRTREGGFTEGLVHVAVAGAEPELREAAARALEAVGDPRTGEFLKPHLYQDRALALAGRFPHRSLAPALIAALRELNRQIDLLERVPETVVLDLHHEVEPMKARRRLVHDALVAIAGSNIGGYDDSAWQEAFGR